MALARSQVNDPLAVAAVRDIEAELAVERERASVKNLDMIGRLSLGAAIGEPETVALIAVLAADAELETWLMRRVNLTRASGRPPAANEHPENE